MKFPRLDLFAAGGLSTTAHRGSLSDSAAGPVIGEQAPHSSSARINASDDPARSRLATSQTHADSKSIRDIQRIRDSPRSGSRRGLRAKRAIGQGFIEIRRGREADVVDASTLDGQAVVVPADHPARQISDLRKAGLLQHRHGLGRASTGTADGDRFGVHVQRADSLGELP